MTFWLREGYFNEPFLERKNSLSLSTDWPGSEFWMTFQNRKPTNLVGVKVVDGSLLVDGQMEEGRPGAGNWAQLHKQKDLPHHLVVGVLKKKNVGDRLNVFQLNPFHPDCKIFFCFYFYKFSGIFFNFKDVSMIGI